MGNGIVDGVLGRNTLDAERPVFQQRNSWKLHGTGEMGEGQYYKGRCTLKFNSKMSLGVKLITYMSHGLCQNGHCTMTTHSILSLTIAHHPNCSGEVARNLNGNAHAQVHAE